MFLHDARDDGGDESPGSGQQPSADRVEERAIACRSCQAEVSRPRHVFAARDGRSVHVFPNPAGVMQEIVTLTTVWSVVADGHATTEFTWFSGYAWTVAYCARCRVHLGWRFDSVGADRPTSFFGLLVSRLTGL